MFKPLTDQIRNDQDISRWKFNFSPRSDQAQKLWQCETDKWNRNHPSHLNIYRSRKYIWRVHSYKLILYLTKNANA